MPEPDDARPLAVAYCGPGLKSRSEAVLAERGEAVSEVIEHPWLEGYRDVLLFWPPPDPPMEFPVSRPFADTLRDLQLERILAMTPADLRRVVMPGV